MKLLLQNYLYEREDSNSKDDIDTKFITNLCQFSTPDEAKEICDKLQELNKLYPEKKFLNRTQWWRYCFLTDRNDILRYLIDAGFKIKVEGNIIRQAVYMGKLDAAKILVEYKYPVPDTLSIFQISSQINWEPDRITFLVDHGCKIKLSKKEAKSISIIYDAAQVVDSDEDTTS